MNKSLILTLLIPCVSAWAQDAVQSAHTASATNFFESINKTGIHFPLNYTGEVLGNATGGSRQGLIYDGVLEAGVQVEFCKCTGWEGLTFTADAYFPHGSSLTRQNTHDLNVVSNIDAYHFPRLYELWFQQDLFDGKFSIRAGQIPADSEFFLTAYGVMFVNSAFGALPSISLNLSAPLYPVAAPGVRLRWKPDDHWSFQAAVFDGNVGDLRTTNRNGTRFNFNSDNGALWLAEAAYNLNPPPPQAADSKTTAPASRPLSGTYKLGAFLNTADFADNNTGATLHGDYGVYAVADQELWHEPGHPDEGLRGFARFGFAPSDRNLLHFDFEAGLNYIGLLPNRPTDLTGLAFAYTKVSNGILNNAGDAPGRHYESIVELTYQAAVNEHLSVQPDLQYVFNPGGVVSPQHNLLVLGLRFNLTF